MIGSYAKNQFPPTIGHDLHFSVTSGDRQRLQAIVADPRSSQKHVWRARITLKSDEWLGTSAVMTETGKSNPDFSRGVFETLHLRMIGLI